MGKRLTATDIWFNKFFRMLKSEHKFLWRFALETCDIAGVYKPDFELFELLTGFKINESEVKEVFKDRFYWFDNDSKIFIPKFIDFQYGVLGNNSKIHIKVVELLMKYNINEFYNSYLREKEKAIIDYPEGIDRVSIPLNTNTNTNTNTNNNILGECENPLTPEPSQETATINPDEILKKWNSFSKSNNLTQIIRLTSTRRQGILNRFNEKDFDFDAILKKIKESDFLLGKVKGWKIDFDFLFLSADNYLKILEGKYANSGESNNGFLKIPPKDLYTYFYDKFPKDNQRAIKEANSMVQVEIDNVRWWVNPEDAKKFELKVIPLKKLDDEKKD